MARSAGHAHAADGGFTLLELLVVMVIIGLLAGYVGPKYFSQIGKSEVKVARAQIDALGKALDQYRLDIGHYPSTEQGLAALVDASGQRGQMGRPLPAERRSGRSLGQSLRFRHARRARRVRPAVVRQGRQPGGDGEAGDITNW